MLVCLTPVGGLLVVQRIQAGMPQVYVAKQMGLSRAVVGKWWHRFCEHGEVNTVSRGTHRRPSTWVTATCM